MNRLSLMKFFLAIVAIAIFVSACNKDNTNSRVQNKQIADFRIADECLISLSNSTQIVDSNLTFVNFSHLQDTLQPGSQGDVTYRWEFGDQTVSTEKSPTHQYHKPGKYTVKLFTYLDSQLSDSTSASLQIVVGTVEFRFNTDCYGIGLAQAEKKAVLALYKQTLDFNSSSFGIMKVDSLAKVEWINNIAGTDAGVRLSSIERINSNAYIVSGNYLTGNPDQFCLSKIDSSGNLIWNKYIDNLYGRNDVTVPVSDGGFLTTGTAVISNTGFAAIVKCDQDGNELWRKVFDSAKALVSINNFVEVDSGYVFAATYKGPFPGIVLSRMDFNGNVTKQTVIDSINSFGGGAGVLYNDNTFLAYYLTPVNGNYIYLFDNDFSYLGSKPFSEGPILGGFVNRNQFVVYTRENQGPIIAQLGNDGTTNWVSAIDPTSRVGCHSPFSGGFTFCRKIIHLDGDEIMTLSDSKNQLGWRSIFLQKLSPEGKLR